MNKDNPDKVNNDYLNDEEEFMDIQTGMIMNRSEFNSKIKNGQYPGYYVTDDHADQLTDGDLEG